MLEHLRQTIQSVAPDAEECISYDIPTFRLGGRMLVSFGAAAKHCAFYAGAHPVQVQADELTGYSTSKGTIRFQADSPLPVALVRKLVKTRIAQRLAEGGPRDRADRSASPALTADDPRLVATEKTTS